MPIAKVQLPDGRIAKFDVADGTTPEQVTAFAEQQFGAQKPSGYSVPADSTAGKVVAALDKVEATPYIGPVVKGIRDVTKGGAQLLAHGIHAVAPSILSEEDLKSVDNDVRVGEQNYQAARKANGSSGIDLGRIAGGVLATGPMVPAKAVSVPGAIGKATLTGGMLGALNPVTTDGSFAADKVKQVGIGAITGGAASGAVAGLSRIVRPNTAPEVQRLIDEGVTPTPGQILGGGLGRFEEKLMSVPYLGDAIRSAQTRSLEQFNKAAYNRALAPIGKKAGDDVGRDGVAAVKSALGDAYDNLLPKLQFKADQTFASDLNNLMGMASNMPGPQAKQFEKIVRDKVVSRLGPQGNMDGIALKGVESELSRIAKGYKGDVSFDNRQLGDAVGELLVSLRQTLQRSNPQHADQLAKINQGFANYARIRDAASRVGAEDGVFTAAQLQSAVRSADKSVGKGQFATGNALMQDLSDAGKKVLGGKVPNSGTADRAMAGPGVGALLATRPMAVLGLAGGTLPYTATGQKVVASLLTQRPDIAEPIARGLLATSPMLGAATAGGLLGVYGPSAP